VTPLDLTSLKLFSKFVQKSSYLFVNRIQVWISQKKETFFHKCSSLNRVKPFSYSKPDNSYQERRSWDPKILKYFILHLDAEDSDGILLNSKEDAKDYEKYDHLYFQLKKLRKMKFSRKEIKKYNLLDQGSQTQFHMRATF